MFYIVRSSSSFCYRTVFLLLLFSFAVLFCQFIFIVISFDSILLYCLYRLTACWQSIDNHSSCSCLRRARAHIDKITRKSININIWPLPLRRSETKRKTLNRTYTPRRTQYGADNGTMFFFSFSSHLNIFVCALGCPLHDAWAMQGKITWRNHNNLCVRSTAPQPFAWCIFHVCSRISDWLYTRIDDVHYIYNFDWMLQFKMALTFSLLLLLLYRIQRSPDVKREKEKRTK